MYMLNRGARFVRGFLLSYGPKAIKRRLWDREFASGKWSFIDHTVGDCVYPTLEKFARKGRILDLGCGPGNTATELTCDSYNSYLGVDISEEALAKAAKRTESSGRAHKNRFAQADILSFTPEEQFDVILFRESMYHIPIGSILSVLDKYSQYLADRGVFIVRMYTMANGNPKHRPMKMIELIASSFDVMEEYQYSDSGAAVIVFRPRRAAENWISGCEAMRQIDTAF
jgi:SAM-dependent methyltransferase